MKMKMNRGKSAPIQITRKTAQSIKNYKLRLQEMVDNDEVSEYDKKTIDILLNKLCAYETNIFIAYFDLAGESPSALGKLLGISPGVASNRIKSIIKKIRELHNDFN